MISRIDQFKQFKWKAGDTGYQGLYFWVDKRPVVNTFKVIDVVGNGLLETDQFEWKVYPSDISHDKLAAIAISYFKLKNREGVSGFGIPDELIDQAAYQTKMQFFRLLLRKAKKTK